MRPIPPRSSLLQRLGDEDDSSAKSTWVYDLVTRLKAGGTPIDGVGLQSHFPVSGVPSLQEMEANLQRYASAGLEAKFTELDVRLADNTAASLSTQAGAYSQVMNACLAVSSCKGVVTWGFTDGYSWVPQAFPGYGWALRFDATYNPKPAYTALQQALDAGVPAAAGSTVTISAYGTPMGGVYWPTRPTRIPTGWRWDRSFGSPPARAPSDCGPLCCYSHRW